MARIAGVDIPRDKKLPYSLSYIYGIGLTKAKFICDKAKLSQDLRVKDLTDKQVVTIRNIISELNLLIEGEGRTQVSMNIKEKETLDVIKVCDIEEVCLLMVKEQKQIQELEKAEEEQLV